MTRTSFLRAAVTGAAVASLALAGCGDDTGRRSNSNEERLSGTISMDGSSTVGPLAEVAAELFMRDNPGVRITVAMSGTGGGFAKFCAGETQINNASRPIRDDEAQQCADHGIAYDVVQVANDALSLVINADNPVDCLTVEQARQIWDLDSTVRTWGDVDGLDLPAEFAARQITLYGPGTDSGTFDFFTEVVNGEPGRIRLDYVDIGEDDFAAVRGVQGDVAAMGYIPYSYYQAAQGEVRALQIDSGDGCVPATLENVQNGTYTPLGRPLFVYASDVALTRPEVLAFMEYFVSGSDTVAAAAGFVPMTAEQANESMQRVRRLAGGA